MEALTSVNRRDESPATIVSFSHPAWLLAGGAWNFVIATFLIAV
jgi:hypothetical protein